LEEYDGVTRGTTEADLRATHPLTVATRGGGEGGLYLSVTATQPNPTSRIVTFAQDPETLVFGRHRACEVVLAHDGVSRRHAQFTRRGNQISVEDVGSTNGTLVNGVAITAPRRLAAGDVVTLGTVTAVLVATTAVRDRRHIATVTELEDRLDAEVERARRYGRMLALVMLRVTGPTETVEPHLANCVRTLRRMDLLADYGGDELGLLLPEADHAAVDAVLARIGETPPLVTVTSGAAIFPRDGASAGELIGLAHERLRGVAPRRPGHDAMIVADPKMQHVMQMVERVATSQINVLLFGESGTGKEMVAEAIHVASPRALRPFVRLSCGALPESLLESELFGHVEGAFTGAIARTVARSSSTRSATSRRTRRPSCSA
jgi:two-component system, NtrC family, response regulator AtoC